MYVCMDVCVSDVSVCVSVHGRMCVLTVYNRAGDRMSGRMRVLEWSLS